MNILIELIHYTNTNKSNQKNKNIYVRNLKRIGTKHIKMLRIKIIVMLWSEVKAIIKSLKTEVVREYQSDCKLIW